MQEIFAGATCLGKTGKNGKPVVITNNYVSIDARLYANDLGVEIIAQPEWDEFEQVVKTKKVTNPNIHNGLFGFMIASYLNDRSYLGKVMKSNVYDEKEVSKRDLKLQIISEFDAAEECIKESAYLHQKAAQYQQKALELQKQAIIRNIN